ncbi:hypothetical protein [Natronoglycomyces albus]|uniref:Uncharacterized protein n=1 Tax=Natronoglycomyces albus TaxID=2811108 RepID=A0A895XVN9_9ACTN|nr:hypothetical protein [Natronoglycomyces albus]QSB05708.1 hypothetical protein JQS30_01915 [Natronoglycomyces albus]
MPSATIRPVLGRAQLKRTYATLLFDEREGELTTHLWQHRPRPSWTFPFTGRLVCRLCNETWKRGVGCLTKRDADIFLATRQHLRATTVPCEEW